MTPAQLRKVARADSVTAKVISDGCRDYFVQIERDNGAGLLRSRNRNLLRFKSLTEVHQLLGQCNVEDIWLVSRVADDETGRPPGTQSGFSEMRLARQVG
jgi:hypothetical protein